MDKKRLRKKAERNLSAEKKVPQESSSGDLAKLIHELRVHQIELEMQNDELRKAQAEIEESRSRYVELYDFAPVGYLTLDQMGVIGEVNLTGASLLGVEREQLLKTRFSLFVMPEDRDLFRNFQRKVFQVPGMQSCELRLKSKADNPRWVHLAGAAVEASEGESARMRVTASDISERKQTEDALRAAAEIKQAEAERKNTEERIIRQNAVLDGINRIFKETLSSRTVEELGQTCLIVAAEVTGSKFGFMGEIGPDGLLHDIALSNPGWEGCALYDKTGPRRPPGNFKIHGLYGRVLKDGRSLIANQPASHPDRIGVPEGHPPLTAFLGVPLIQNGKTIGIIALGNREGGFRDEDRDALEALAPAVVESLGRKRAEEALRQSAQFPQENPNPILRIAADGALLYANPPGRDWLASLAWEIDGPLPAPVRAAVTAAWGKDRAIETEIRNPKGATFSVLAIQPRGENYVNLYLVNITPRKRTLEALRRNREDLDRAQQVGQIGSWRLDVRRNILTWSDETHRIFGVPKGTPLTYQTFLGSIHPEDRQDVDMEWQAGLRGEPYDLEHRIVVGQQVKWVHQKAYLEFDNERKLLGGFGIVQDITDRKRADETLRLSEEKFAKAFATNPAAIAITRLQDGLIMEANETWLAMFGYRRDEVIGRSTLSLQIWPTPEARARYAEAVGAKGSMRGWEQTLRRRSGEPLVLLGWAEILTMAGEKVFLSTWLDITERKRAEQALIKAKDELEIRVQERTEELAKSQQRLQQLASQLLLAQERERKRVAVELHDGLLSELAATKYLVEGKLMLMEKGKPCDPGEFRRVADILAVTMKETRRIMNNLHPSILDELGLIAAIGWLCGEYQKSYPHILVQEEIAVLEEDIAGGIRVVIFRVLQEALNNFAKHGKGDRVEVSLLKADGTFSFVIRDNGQGFDMAKVEKGLGLESMRERVELSGGSFILESARGVGTSIRASWPSPDIS